MKRLCKYPPCGKTLETVNSGMVFSVSARKPRRSVKFCSNVCYVLFYQSPKARLRRRHKPIEVDLPAFDMAHWKEELAFRTAVNELFQIRKEKKAVGEHLDEDRALKELSILGRIELFRRLFA